MLSIFKFTDFVITDVGMSAKIPSNALSQFKNGFFVAYFDGSYKEKFTYKRDLTSTTNSVIGMVFHSDNGNRINLVIG
jgi:hypothetical protein